jgi:predicted ATPase
MYIEYVELFNIKTFPAATNRRSGRIELLHPDADFRSPKAPTEPGDRRIPKPRLKNVTLLLGNNGSGKTTVLRAIAASAFGPAAKDLLRDGSMVRHGEDAGLIRAQLVLHEQDAETTGALWNALNVYRRGERLDVGQESAAAQLQQASVDDPAQLLNRREVWERIYESKNDAFFIVGYGATRRVERLDSFDSGARTKSKATRDLRVQGLFEDSFSLIPLSSWLPREKERNPGRYKQVVNLLSKLLKPGDYTFSGKQDERGEYLFLRGDMPIPFQSLSDGYRAFIGWVADLLYHLCYGCPSGKKLVDNRGVVLVDEIDLNLHPSWQMKVIPTIATALPNMQFVFTSHSPLVAGSLEWMNILTLKVTSKTNVTIAKRLKQSIHGLDADQILLTDFFGLKSTRAPSKRAQLQKLRREATIGNDDDKLAYVRALSFGSEANKNEVGALEEQG